MSDGVKNAEKIRVLVLGDSGVGKTSLIELVCSGEELRKPRSTVGCAIHMKIHESRATGRHCFVEFWDIGGSERFKESRHVFYGTAFDGILLVYDLANSVSRRNLEKWRQEWQQVHFGGEGGGAAMGGGASAVWTDELAESSTHFSPSRRSRDQQGVGVRGPGANRVGSAGFHVATPPVLTIGNKQDLVGGGVGGCGDGGGHGGIDVEVEGGSGCHEIAVSACRKSKTGVAGGARDYQTICQHMELFFDRIMEARELQVSAGLGGSAWNVGGRVASASAPSAESRSAAFSSKESKRD